MQNARRATGARNETLQAAAQRLYDDAGRNSKAAIDLVLAEIRKRPALHEDAYRIAAESLIGMLDRTDRAAVMRGKDVGTVTVAEAANDQPVKFTPQSEASKNASNRRLQRFSVALTGLYLTKFKFGGDEFLLGQATPEQLRPVAAHYLGQGSTMVRTARWLERVIAAAKDGEPIHRSVKLKEIERMKNEAFSFDV
ncbi:hypothetical protein BTE77_06890 [Ensifer adhaerens]|nr:hypothetical protein BTE77_06890 [Ensifer adhaerens]